MVAMLLIQLGRFIYQMCIFQLYSKFGPHIKATGGFYFPQTILNGRKSIQTDFSCVICKFF
uniref:Uncharacterized protein n=1 Tax=Anguilla anguilla TaxID=7936 RepID=A0A0E9SXI7_ANGAN